MNKIQGLEQFLMQGNFQIPISSFIVNLMLAAFFAYLLGHVYVRFGAALSNRKMFARNFILITMITMLVISIVKSSLALSLGLVGALSIVRFRAAIKEPEELAYLFFAIALGLGFGANQGLITGIAFIVMCGVIALSKEQQGKEQNKNLFITISANKPRNVQFDEVVDVLSRYCPDVVIKRLDAKKDFFEASFLVEFEDFKKFNEAQAALLSLDDTLALTFLDQKDLSV